nr:uncharacterized protein LOC105347248 isoform X2 [Crassostrea gigas]XP_034317478.1 uncharacterized protein LOC105347248 isoform X2 [Crassostrea gigas]XP_034317479.1 uncharacterized protein LOC105347248 isoform X2 [Crassostrea gigas]XP_034317480.1 uncharacterized protein LOC105347248 isoform X2 [Crassostrea gigas]
MDCFATEMNYQRSKTKHRSTTFRIILILHFISLNRNDGMPCNASLPTAKSVERCPRNDLEWKARAAYVSCSSVEQSCVESDMFVYHCVLNAEGTKRIEVCAPVKFIHGKKCPEFNNGGMIIQEGLFTCSNHSVPCPVVYKSSEAYKYQECFDILEKQHQKNSTEIMYRYIYETSQLLYIIGGLVVSLVICTGLNVYGIGGKIRGKFFSTDRKDDRKSKYNSKENGRTLIAVDEI